jgi:ribonuclease J
VKTKLRVIPFGGLSEIGKNMMALEYEGDIIIIDAGIMFPAEDMFGIDLLIPDISYVLEHKDKVRGIVITHGHEDHIGALPYILPQLDVPVYCTKLTQGLISVKLKEVKAAAGAKLKLVQYGSKITLGQFKIEFFPVCHSIPDSSGLIINTPVGVVVHTGDFKLDYTPAYGKPTDLARLAQAGAQGVLLLMSDSTHAELPGYTPSESTVGDTLDRVIAEAPGRVIVATFSSLVSRVQQVIDAAARHQRRVFIVGRSMVDTTGMALELGYLKAPEGLLGRIEEVKGLAPNRVVIVTTGSQGEPTSALVRMANREYNKVHIVHGDTVIVSATPIPGNEGLVNRTVDMLFKRGARVFYSTVEQVHVHGHASQEELKLLLNLVKPKFFMPIHGEYRQLSLHAKLAQMIGIPPENTMVLEDGDVLEVTPQTAKVVEKLDLDNVYIDGLSVGDVGNVVLHNRKLLSRDGMVVVVLPLNKQTGRLMGRPDVVSRGFVDTRESKEMIEGSLDTVVQALEKSGPNPADMALITTKVKDILEKYYYEQTKRRPMVLPFVVKV